LIGVALAFALFNWPLVQPRLGLTSQGVEIRSVDARLLQFAAARQLIQIDPISGAGLGNYAIALFTLARDFVADYPVYQPVHNVPLLATAELGIVGGVLWLGLICAPWLAMWRLRSHLWVGPWWAGVSGALASLLIVSFFDSYVWSSQQGRLLFWLVLGLWGRAWLERMAISD
jgi:O-antigen ligase